MKSSSRGFTWVELLVCLVVVLIFIWLAIPTVGVGFVNNKYTRALSNARQLHIAIQCMTLDNSTAGSSVEWTCSNTIPLTVEQLTNALANGYLTAADLRKVLTVTEERRYWFDKVTYPAFNFFAVTDSDSKETLFLATKNWHGIASTHLSGAPFGNEAFIIVKKGGEGQILKAKSLNDTNAIGTGGMHNYLPLK